MRLANAFAVMQALPVMDLGTAQYVMESRGEDASAVAGDAGLAAMASVWAVIFQQQILPQEMPKAGDSLEGSKAEAAEGVTGAQTSEPTQTAVIANLVAGVAREAVLPQAVMGPALMAQTIGNAVREVVVAAKDAGELKEAITKMPGPVLKAVLLGQAKVAQGDPSPLVPVPVEEKVPELPEVALGEGQVVEVPVALPVVAMPVPDVAKKEGTVGEAIAAPAEAGPKMVPQVVAPAAAPQVQVGVPMTKMHAPIVAPVAELNSNAGKGFETVVALRKKIAERVMPRAFELREVKAEVLAEAVTPIPAESVVAVEPSKEQPQPVSLQPQEAAPIEDLQSDVPMAADEPAVVAGRADDVVPQEKFAPKVEVDSGPSQSTVVAPVVVKEAAPPSPAVAVPAPAATPKPTPTRPPEAPVPMPAPAGREPKTISIRIPLTDADRASASGPRHIDLVFHQKNQDLTLQFHSPSGDVQRRLEDSMPSLMERLRTEDWGARPQDAPTANLPLEAVVEPRRRVDSLMSTVSQSEMSRDTVPVPQSGSQNFGFDDAQPDRNGSQQQQQNGRNRKREQAFQAELDEQQDA